ncbi:MAG: TylF/MycF/NovP-related O-methyltransferase [Pseudomonadota bacterium]
MTDKSTLTGSTATGESTPTGETTRAGEATLTGETTRAGETTRTGDPVLPGDFDPRAYLLLNPDVAAAGVDAAAHYLAHGVYEGRAYAGTVYAGDGLQTVHNHDFLADPAFRSAYGRGLRAAGSDYLWHWRVHVGLWAARTASLLPGDFVECGVNRGFLASAIMHDLDWNRQDRTFWLLDTFAGIDIGTDGTDLSEVRNRSNLESGFYTADVEAVRRNFAEWRNVEIIVGAVPGTLPQITAGRIAFASIDMNSAPPEVAAMEFLWDRLVAGAVVVLDDYAYAGYGPQKEAMDAFAAEQGVAVLSLPTGQGLIIRPPGSA